MIDDEHTKIMESVRRYVEEQDRKHGGPPPPLTPEELDASETEIHNMLRRGRPEPESD